MNGCSILDLLFRENFYSSCIPSLYHFIFAAAPALQESLPSRLTFSSSSLTLGCTSFQSPPTFVTWLKDDVEVVVDGTTIREVKAVQDRSASSYLNMLLINMEPDNLLGRYSCNVSNVLGSSGFSDVLTINGELFSIL